MRNRTFYYTGLYALLVFFLSACGTGQKQFDVGMQLSQAGKYKEAIAYMEQAIANEPHNKEYQKTLAELKESWVDKFVAQGKNELGPADTLTMAAIGRARAKLIQAREIDAENAAVTEFARELESKETDLLTRVNSLYDQAKQYIESEEWLKAYFVLQQIQTSFPNYENSFQLLIRTADQGSHALYEKGKALFDNHNFKGATESFTKALSLKADHKPSQEHLAIVRERDNKGYFVKKARKAAQSRKWDDAVTAYERALEYDPQDRNLPSLIDLVRAKAVDYYIRTANDLMNEGWLLKAFEHFDLAGKYAGKPEPSQLGRLRRDLCSRASSLASGFKDQGNIGSAWFWYMKIKGINSQFPGIFHLTQAMEDRIRQKVKKSIAVFDFSSPSDNADAGIIVANNLITYLFKTASGDIKILERENLKSILEEMKLGQIGVVSANSAKEMGRVYGIDVAIMGSVLLFKVDSTSSRGTKTVRYEIGTKIEDNLEYLNWIARHPKASSELLAKAPPAKVRVPEYAEKEYVVSRHKKIGFMQISFRIVEVSTGENIQVKTIERKIEVEDETSAGLTEAKIEYDPLEIATDTEILQQMTNDVVAELGREALRPLQNLEQIYFQSGENYMRRRDVFPAAENFVEALFDEKLKRIQSSPITLKTIENLNNIFRDYRVD
ncbi:MAG: CsgG/HfaB family protein [Thermodesulfobacteriota bacterium]|nr:CsgG/HfaB family protein [Thermodesulfobacteriota bacterium]